MNYQHGFQWYFFAVFLTWLGIILTVVFSIRAALLTREDNTLRLWRRSFMLPNRRAVARRRSYQ